MNAAQTPSSGTRASSRSRSATRSAVDARRRSRSRAGGGGDAAARGTRPGCAARAAGRASVLLSLARAVRAQPHDREMAEAGLVAEGVVDRGAHAVELRRDRRPAWRRRTRRPGTPARCRRARRARAHGRGACGARARPPARRSRLRYTDARSERGTRPITPSATRSAESGAPAAKSVSSTSLRAVDARRPRSRRSASASSTLAAASGGVRDATVMSTLRLMTPQLRTVRRFNRLTFRRCKSARTPVRQLSGNWWTDLTVGLEFLYSISVGGSTCAGSPC